MNELNKQIEEEANLYASVASNVSDYNTLFHSFKKGYKSCLHSSRWRKVSEELPPEGEEVLFFHEDWIDEDFNPKGIRIGFYESDDYTTAKWWSIQDCYMTILHSECDDNPSFSDKTRNSIEPQRWKPID